VAADEIVVATVAAVVVVAAGGIAATAAAAAAAAGRIDYQSRSKQGQIIIAPRAPKARATSALPGH
jgi:hypothetical protein